MSGTDTGKGSRPPGQPKIGGHQDLPGSICSPLFAPTTNSLLVRVHHSSNQSRTDENARPLEVEI